MATRIRELRQKKQMRMSDLARAAQINYNTLCRYENGYANPGEETARRLAAVLEVPVSEISSPVQDFLLSEIDDCDPSSAATADRYYRIIVGKLNVGAVEYLRDRLSAWLDS